MTATCKSRFATVATMLAVLFFLAPACTQDPAYDLDHAPLDPSMTFFGDGVVIPLGQTEKISLSSLLNAAGESINDVIQKEDDGTLSIKYGDSVSLTDKLEELDLQSLANIKGESFETNFPIKIDVGASDFSIDGQEFALSVNFDGFDVVNVSTGDVSANADGLSFHAGLDQYKNVIAGNADLDLGASIGEIHYDQKLLEKATLSNQAALYPVEEIPVSKELVPDVNLPNENIALKVDAVQLDEKITSLSNVKTNPNAKLVVKIEATNVFFTEGKMTPDINIDFSKHLVIKGGSNVNLKDMVLTQNNGWTLTKTFDVEGLVKTDYEGGFSLDDVVPVSGKVSVDDAKTTKTKISQVNGDMSVSIVVKFTDLTIASADLAITADPFQLTDQISLGNFQETELPDGIVDVKSITLDETKPIVLKITPKNLDRLKNKNLIYTFTLDFPESIEVQGAINGKLTLGGDLANGPATQNIVLKKIKPTVNGNKLSLDADVNVTALVEPKNMVLNSDDLPNTPDEDLSFEVSIEGSPVIKDYLIVLDNYEEQLTGLSGKLEIEADGLGDIDSIHIVPEGTPALVINFNIPDLNGLNLKPGKDGIVVSLPEFMVFDGSAIDAAYAFNKDKNSITISNSFPNSISLPIKELNLQPTVVGGKTMIVGNYSAEGSISLPGSEVSQAQLKETFGSEVGLTISVPQIKASSIKIDGEISKEINEKFDLKISNLPSQLKSIDEVALKDVYVTMDAVFEGLPASADAPFDVDLTLTLPEFIQPNVIPIKGSVTGGKLSVKEQIRKICNVVPDEKGAIQGEIGITGKISADGSKINLADFNSDVNIALKAAIGDSNNMITIEKATGHFTYDISEKTSLKLDNLPDMLKSENLTLDFVNPTLSLDIESNMGIPMVATVSLVPIRGGVADNENAISFENVRLPYSTDPSKKETASLTADVSGLLNNLPDELEVAINAYIDPETAAILEPAAKYELDIKYEINVPLKFGKDFKFQTETEIDLRAANSITSLGAFGIQGKVLNETPLNLNADLVLLDAEGNVVPQETPVSISIPGAATSDFSLALNPTDKTRAIQKAKLTVKVTAVPNKGVKETDCLQFLDLVAVAPEGITVGETSIFKK